jgi:DNA processing protein
MAQDPLSKPLTALDEGEKFDWLELLRCEYIGPRTFQRLLNRHGSAGAALAALLQLIASSKAGRPIRIATIEETEREIEATFKLGGRFIALCEPEYPMLLRRADSAPPLIAAIF